MKQSYYLTPDINEDAVHDLIDFLNMVLGNPEITDIDIYLHSVGGYDSSAQIIKNILKNCPLTITLIAAGEVSSAAWDIFYFTEKVYKRILPGTVAVLHIATHTIESRDLHRNEQWVSQQKIKLELMNIEKYEAFYNYTVLPPILLEKWKNGENVMLVYPEIVELMSRCPYGVFE
jgi:ATP-dependent protease ClpP protease subunit